MIVNMDIKNSIELEDKVLFYMKSIYNYSNRLENPNISNDVIGIIIEYIIFRPCVGDLIDIRTDKIGFTSSGNEIYLWETDKITHIEKRNCSHSQQFIYTYVS